MQLSPTKADLRRQMLVRRDMIEPPEAHAAAAVVARTGLDLVRQHAPAGAVVRWKTSQSPRAPTHRCGRPVQPAMRHRGVASRRSAIVAAVAALAVCRGPALAGSQGVVDAAGGARARGARARDGGRSSLAATQKESPALRGFLKVTILVNRAMQRTGLTCPCRPFHPYRPCRPYLARHDLCHRLAHQQSSLLWSASSQRQSRRFATRYV